MPSSSGISGARRPLISKRLKLNHTVLTSPRAGPRCRGGTSTFLSPAVISVSNYRTETGDEDCVECDRIMLRRCRGSVSVLRVSGDTLEHAELVRPDRGRATVQAMANLVGEDRLCPARARLCLSTRCSVRSRVGRVVLSGLGPLSAESKIAGLDATLPNGRDPFLRETSSLLEPPLERLRPSLRKEVN